MILDRVVQLQSAGHGSPSSMAIHGAPSSAFWSAEVLPNLITEIAQALDGLAVPQTAVRFGQKVPTVTLGNIVPRAFFPFERSSAAPFFLVGI